MNGEIITLGNNIESPVVCMETAQDVYAAVEQTEEFDIAKFNGLLMGIVTYLDHHEVDYGDKALPWAELVKKV